MLIDQFPRFQLGDFPTPLYKCKNIEKSLGIKHFYIKRDDLSGLAFGGNKVRFLGGGKNSGDGGASTGHEISLKIKEISEERQKNGTSLINNNVMAVGNKLFIPNQFDDRMHGL